MSHCRVASLVLFALIWPTLAAAQRRPSLSPLQTLDSSQFTGQVAVDGSVPVALIGLTAGHVATTTYNVNTASWSTGVPLIGTTSTFGIDIAAANGWALIAEDQSAKRVRVYHFSSGAYTQSTTIDQPTLPATDEYGARVALSHDGTTGLISAFDHDLTPNAGDDQGIVYVVKNNGSTWPVIQNLDEGNEATINGKFGLAMTLSNDGAVIAIAGAQRVRIYARDPASGLYHQEKLLTTLTGNDQFGWSIDLAENGETLAVGAPSANDGAGAVYFYRRDGGTWDNINTKNPFPNGTAVAFGRTVSIRNGLLVAAVPRFEEAPGVFATAIWSWGNDLDRPSGWQLPVSPGSTQLADDSSVLEIAADGQWVFIGAHSNTVLPIVQIDDVFVQNPFPLPRGDFDRDGTSDFTVFRPSTGTWWTRTNTGTPATSAVNWGLNGDVPLVGDFDRDITPDRAVFRPSTSTWWIRGTSLGVQAYQWGQTGDVPVPADYDGDGYMDVAIFRPSTGAWWILGSLNGFTTYTSVVWGQSGDIPVRGDFDGDHKADVAVYRPGSHTWWILKSSTNNTAFTSMQWGADGDIPTPGDYDDDNKADIAVFRPSTGTWWIAKSLPGLPNILSFPFGAATDIPLSGDFDNDGNRADIAVFRPDQGLWAIRKSSTEFFGLQFVTWGLSTDIPVLR